MPPTVADKLLEREAELALVDERLANARDGHGSMLLIEGPAGIGKTELLRVAGERAIAAGMETLTARGGELEQSLGFGIVRQLFERRLVRAGAPERRAILAGAARLAAPALGPAEAAPARPETSVAEGDPAAAVHHGLYWLCANLAERASLALLVDDLHWADPASARWLIYLARRLEDLPALLVATVRSGEPGLDPSLLGTLSGDASTPVARPAALSELATGELIRERLEDPDERFRAACHRVTDGNPFLIGELIEAVRQDAIPPTAESVARIEGLAPETISRSTMLRLARLPDGAEPLTRAIAVLGAAAEPRHAAALAELDDKSAAKAADALAAASMLASERPLRFAHPLLRAAVYEQIPVSERALAHARAARMLAEEGAPAEQVATQLLHAEPAADERVVSTLRDAARQAAARGTPDAAVAYLRRALLEPPPQRLRTELMRQLLDAAQSVGAWSCFEGISDDPAAELSAALEENPEHALSLGRWLLTMSRFSEATAAMERAISIVAARGDNELANRIESLMLSLLPTEAPEDVVKRVERYADRIEPGSPGETMWLGISAWWRHLTPGASAAEAASLAKRALDDRRVFDEQGMTAVPGQALIVLLHADELDVAEPLIDEMIEDVRRRGWLVAVASLGAVRTLHQFRRGDVSAAAEEGRASLDMVRELGALIALINGTGWLVDALIELDLADQADEQIATSGLWGEIPTNWWLGPAFWARARVRLAQGRTEEAIADLRGWMRANHESTWPAFYPLASTLALALISAGEDRAEASRLAELELNRAREWGTPRGIGVALRASGLVEGGERGIELLSEAANVLSASPARVEHARALADLGAALRRAKRRTEAREPLREAVDLAHRCRAQAIEERAREELAATGAKPRRVMLLGVDSLTPSELRIAKLAAQGMQNKEIAQTLFVSVKTVETHLGHVYGKLEIDSRKRLAAALNS